MEIQKDPWGNDETSKIKNLKFLNNPGENAIPEHILVNLRPFEKHRQATCLKCGYNGMMGVQREC